MELGFEAEDFFLGFLGYETELAQLPSKIQEIWLLDELSASILFLYIKLVLVVWCVGLYIFFVWIINIEFSYRIKVEKSLGCLYQEIGVLENRREAGIISSMFP